MAEPIPASLPTAEACLPRGTWDALLSALVLAFAFLVASFPIGNSDFWRHLATGRLVAQGEYSFGSDPFGYSVKDAYWANHSWLFDLALYAGHQSLGDPTLVIFKALAVLALAGLMLRVARHTGPFWISGSCILIALLAMNPHLLLQPACASFLLLGVCLWLLQRGGRALYALPAVIALWVNVDAWFILGPLLVLLHGLGEMTSRRQKAERSSTTNESPCHLVTLSPCHLRWLLPACLLACLLSPHHYRALRLPAELSPAVWNGELRHDVRFAQLFASPWDSDSLTRFDATNLSASAYFALLFLSAISFAVNWRGLRSWRLPVWLVFALLGAWQASMVPFFAIVAGPITALNFGQRLSVRTLRRTGRLGLFLTSLVLLALTWPGWLQGFNRHDRPLSWSVRPDPSLVHMAGTVARWREQGLLPPKVRTFATRPKVADYLVWFCPGEKVFVDSRLSLFASKLGDYERVCRELDPTLDPHSNGDVSSEWERVLRENHIGCVVLYDPDSRHFASNLLRISQRQDRWDVLSVDGQAVVVGWKQRSIGVPRFDPERSAFAGIQDDSESAAPRNGPDSLALPIAWWERYLDRPSGSTWQSNAAATYLDLFDAGEDEQRQRQRLPVLARHIAGLIGLPFLQTTGVVASIEIAERLYLQDLFLPDLSERPPALPLLAVCAARQAIAAHPDDALAWHALARAYLVLGRGTAEGARYAMLPPLAQIRQIQTVTALVQAVTLKPDLIGAHLTLARLFAEARFFDLALRHRDVQLALMRKGGPLPGEDKAAFDVRVDRFAKSVDELRIVVEDNENRFVIRTQMLAANPLARAKIALDLGLAGKAIDDVLLRSHADLYGKEGIRLLLELLLRTGRAQEARIPLDRAEMRDNPAGLGVHQVFANSQSGRGWSYPFSAYDWFDLCQSSAAGQYDRASNTLDRLRGQMKLGRSRQSNPLIRQLAFRVTTELGLAATPAEIARQLFRPSERDQAIEQFVQNEFLQVEQADLHVVEGMLLLEQGQSSRASEEFQRSLNLYQSASGLSPALPGKPLAERYLWRIRNVVR